MRGGPDAYDFPREDLMRFLKMVINAANKTVRRLDQRLDTMSREFQELKAANAMIQQPEKPPWLSYCASYWYSSLQSISARNITNMRPMHLRSPEIGQLEATARTALIVWDERVPLSSSTTTTQKVHQSMRRMHAPHRSRNWHLQH
jgi:hypothetical protein